MTRELQEFKAIEAARKVYNDTLNGYSQRTALKRAFKVYEERRPK